MLFIEYSDDMNDVLDDINEYNINRDEKVLIVLDDMIADIEYNKNFKRIIKELFYRARKINVSIAFITRSYFRTLKDARLNSTHYILMRIGNKNELKRIAEEKSGHLDYKDFFKMYNYCTKNPYSFMTIDTRPTATIQFKKVLIVFNDMIADIEYNKNFKRIIKELFYRARKINVSIVFITQSYFRTLKDARLNSTHYILMRIGNKNELKRIAEEKLGHLDYKDFFKMYNYCTKDPYSFMTIDTRPTATIQFKKTFNESIDLSEPSSLECSSLERNFEKIFINNDS